MVLHVFRPHVNGIIFMCAETYFFCSFQYDDCGIHPYSHRAIFSFLLLYNIALDGSTTVIYPLLIGGLLGCFQCFALVPTLLETLALLLVRVSEGGGWENNRWVRGHVNLQLSQLLPYRLQSSCYQLVPTSTWESSCSSTSSPNLEWSDCKVVANVM